MQYNIGDSVRFMDFEGDGKVTAVLEHGFLEIEVDGMSMRVSEREVVRVEADEGKDERLLYDGNTQVSRFKQHPADVRHSASARKRSSREAEVMVVDLHLDKIRLKYPAARNIPDQDALYVQLDVFGKSMAEAFRKGVRTVVLIHGNGRGGVFSVRNCSIVCGSILAWWCATLPCCVTAAELWKLSSDSRYLRFFLNISTQQ